MTTKILSPHGNANSPPAQAGTPNGYVLRQLTPKQREEILAWRKNHNRTWHSPPHRPNHGQRNFLISAALLEVLQQHAGRTVAWCVRPNHYHALVETPNILKLLYALGRFHGRTSHVWIGEENTRGRQVFHGAVERFVRFERHFFATVNYVHNNPVHHG